MITEDKKPVIDLLEAGLGTIGKDYTSAMQAIAERAVDGEFHTQTNETIVCKCIDGRTCPSGLEGPNSAGGTLSLLVADDLSGSECYASQDMPIAHGLHSLAIDLQKQDLPIGMHTDTHAIGDASGCGANDKLANIYQLIHTMPGIVREIAEAILGYNIDTAVHELLTSRAAGRSSFSSGTQNHQVIAGLNSEATEKLEGDHDEIIALINHQPGTTLYRGAFDRATGGTCQAFNIDVWAFPESARVISETSDDQQEIETKVAALAYYNAATALTLCGPRMRVGVIARDESLAT